MLNWQGWAANWLGWGPEGGSAPAPAPERAVSGVSGKRRKPRAYIEIDDQLFPVESEAEARQLLALARKVARQTVKRAKVSPVAEMPVPIVSGHGSELIAALAAETQRYVVEQHKKAALARARADDDDDAEVLLLSL